MNTTTTTPATLAEIIVALKCRKGKASGTTKHGAYWLACDEILIRSWGGDGIGNNGANLRSRLQLRHFRDGSVRCVARMSSWHQNCGTHNNYVTVRINDCRTVEDVITALLGESDSDGVAVYSAHFAADLTAALVALGMPESEPAPDETPEA